MSETRPTSRGFNVPPEWRETFGDEEDVTNTSEVQAYNSSPTAERSSNMPITPFPQPMPIRKPSDPKPESSPKEDRQSAIGEIVVTDDTNVQPEDGQHEQAA